MPRTILPVSNRNHWKFEYFSLFFVQLSTSTEKPVEKFKLLKKKHLKWSNEKYYPAGTKIFVNEKLTPMNEWDHYQQL